MDNNAYSQLIKSIDHWNEYRVPILRISHPDANLQFKGAMRFYFQDAGQKVATKCVNVSSSDTTKDVIDVLIEKFRPDMRMLSVPEYGLYEIHENGDERKLDPDERPLFVQLEWNQDDREGRFLLRRMDEKTREIASQNEEPSLKRKLSKKEIKKQDKIRKQQIKNQEKAEAAANKAAKNSNIAKKLYNELPETSFTRSISNPEAVMKRQRAQKLEKRLQEAGGTLRIFGETINKDVSYKTLLLSTRDTAIHVVKQCLEKYGKVDEDPNNYCLVQLIVPHSATSTGDADSNSIDMGLNGSNQLREFILEDHDCPLLIYQNHDSSKGYSTFHIRHKPADYQKRRKKNLGGSQVQQQNPLQNLVVQQLNQRLQINNNNNLEQYNNQNSPQNSSQTSGSVNNHFDNLTINNMPLPPSFETVHSVPTMFPSASNGNMIPPQFSNNNYSHHSIQAPNMSQRSTINNYPSHINNNMQHHDINRNIERQSYSQPNIINRQQYNSNQMVPNNHYPMAQQSQNPIPQQNVTKLYNILPALIQVREDAEDAFLDKVITQVNPTDKLLSFRLSPTYMLYMVSRYRASTLFHPELQAPQRAELFTPFTKKIVTLIYNTIEMHKSDAIHLAFWLANSSDLCHFYKQDKHLSYFTQEAQEILNDCILISFKYLLACKQEELDFVLNSFFDDRDEFSDFNEIGINGTNGANSTSSVAQVVDILNETMATMRKNRVNAALTIQVFSHLFHHINKWLFDRIIGVHDQRHQNFISYCTQVWGERLSNRLSFIRSWAEKLGIEQAADFHLGRINQVASFMARRYNSRMNPAEELDEACRNCTRLNPMQIMALLQRYQPEPPILSAIFDNKLMSLEYCYNQNAILPSDYPLNEDYELKFSFLIPSEGYSADMIRGIPGGLAEFVDHLSKIRLDDRPLCIFTIQPTSSGFWTVYFKNHQSDVPEIITIELRKKNNSMGLSIIAAQGIGQDKLGIYIKNVVKNGAAAQDGRLQAGDQLLEVDGNSLIDITQESAAELMQKTGSVVTLRIAKQAATYHNLSDVINSIPSQTVISPQAVVNHHLNKNQHPYRGVMHNHQTKSKSELPPSPLAVISRNTPDNISPNVVNVTVPRQSPPSPAIITVADNNIPGPTPVIAYNRNFNDPPAFNNHIPLGNNNNNNIHTNGNNNHIINSPQKSPKKVSWVDTQPDQKLHTLIPPSPAPQLTIDDINEVLMSGETDNNWPEETAGVIGTQEVYNDPRQRIQQAREQRSEENNDIEHLSFKEKLEMFKKSNKN